MKYYIRKIKNKFPWVSVGPVPDDCDGETFSSKYMYKVNWGKQWYNYYHFAKLKDAVSWLKNIKANYVRVK
jgi:hypothetical protein